MFQISQAKKKLGGDTNLKSVVENVGANILLE